jgi:hypothetical protein
MGSLSVGNYISIETSHPLVVDKNQYFRLLVKQFIRLFSEIDSMHLSVHLVAMQRRQPILYISDPLSLLADIRPVVFRVPFQTTTAQHFRRTGQKAILIQREGPGVCRYSQSTVQHLYEYVRDRISSKVDEIVPNQWREPTAYLEPLQGVPHHKHRIGPFRLGCRVD